MLRNTDMEKPLVLVKWKTKTSRNPVTTKSVQYNPIFIKKKKMYANHL